MTADCVAIMFQLYRRRGQSAHVLRLSFTC